MASMMLPPRGLVKSSAVYVAVWFQRNDNHL